MIYDYTLLDLFSGIGGFSLAFEREGFRTVAFSEVDPYASAVLRKHWPTIPNYGDINKLCRRAGDCEVREDFECFCPRCSQEFSECPCIGSDEFLDTHGSPTVVTAGFPCQDISLNGAGEGLKGARSGLWYQTIRVVAELHPRCVLVENVAALRTRGADTVLSNLEEQGYTCESFVVGADAVGAEHHRERAWILAYDSSVRVEGLRPEGEQITHTLVESLLPLRNRDGQWQVEPDLRRVPNGVPRWMDRVKCCGNAIQPQVAQIFARAIRLSL